MESAEETNVVEDKTIVTEIEHLEDIKARIEEFPNTIQRKLIFGTGPAVDLLRKNCQEIRDQLNILEFSLKSTLARKDGGEGF